MSQIALKAEVPGNARNRALLTPFLPHVLQQASSRRLGSGRGSLYAAGDFEHFLPGLHGNGVQEREATPIEVRTFSRIFNDKPDGPETSLKSTRPMSKNL